MDNTTILAIAVLAAVLVYFLVLRKPSPYPVEKRCVMTHLVVENQIKNQATAMLTFYVLFVNKYGPTPMNQDPVYLSLANIVLAASNVKLEICKSYQEMETLIELFLKTAKPTIPEENKNIAVLMEPTHGDDLAKYVIFVNFFEKIITSINVEKMACCLKH